LQAVSTISSATANAVSERLSGTRLIIDPPIAMCRPFSVVLCHAWLAQRLPDAGHLFNAPRHGNEGGGRRLVASGVRDGARSPLAIVVANRMVVRIGREHEPAVRRL